MRLTYEVVYFDMADHLGLSDLPEDVVRLSEQDAAAPTLDICPPDRRANWIKAQHESGRFEDVENKLGYVGIYVSSCDTPIDNEQHGKIMGQRDFLFTVVDHHPNRELLRLRQSQAK